LPADLPAGHASQTGGQPTLSTNRGGVAQPARNQGTSRDRVLHALGRRNPTGSPGPASVRCRRECLRGTSRRALQEGRWRIPLPGNPATKTSRVGADGGEGGGVGGGVVWGGIRRWKDSSPLPDHASHAGPEDVRHHREIRGGLAGWTRGGQQTPRL